MPEKQTDVQTNNVNNENNEQVNTRVKIHWGRFAIWAVLSLIAILFVIKIYHTILTFGLAGLMAYLLSPAVNFFSSRNIPFTKKKISWLASIIIVYTLLTAIIITSGIVLIPMAIDQVADIIKDTPVLVGKIQDSIKNMETKYKKLNIPPQVEEGINEFVNISISKVGNALGVVFKSIWKLLKGIFSGILLIVLCLAIALFILSNIHNMKDKFYTYIPPNYQDDIRDLLREINDIFGSYVRGYSILCIVNGTLTYLTLSTVPGILGAIPGMSGSFPAFSYTLVASVVAGATYFIPYLGCSLAVVVGMALAFLQFPNFVYVIGIGAIILLTNQFVDRFITPKILGDALGVSTLFIVFAAFAGGELLGVWGMIIGIPAAVMIQSILRFIYKRFLSFPVSEEVLAPAPATATAGLLNVEVSDDNNMGISKVKEEEKPETKEKESN